MKLFNLFTFVIAVLLLSSCGKDFSETVVGTWKLTDIEVLDGCNEPEFDNITLEDGCFTIDGESLCITFVISENGSAQGINTYDGDSETFDLTYTINEDTEVITLCDGSDCNDGTKSGNTLRFSIEEDGCDLIYVFTME